MKRLVSYLILVSFLGCAGQGLKDFQGSVSESAIEKVGQLEIYFGHQSVGNNILDGVDELLVETEAGKRIKILKEEDSPLKGEKGAWIHTYIGENLDPFSKIKDFGDFIRKHPEGADGVAALKFCYVDIHKKTDVKKLFQAYRTLVGDLKASFPGLKFVHFTAPLSINDDPLKTVLKSIMGKKINGHEDNLAKEEFNRLIREAYGNSVFDIAAIESARPDGTREKHSLNNKEYFAIYPGYTPDDGHLNLYARKLIAQKLLKFLADF